MAVVVPGEAVQAMTVLTMVRMMGAVASRHTAACCPLLRLLPHQLLLQLLLLQRVRVRQLRAIMLEAVHLGRAVATAVGEGAGVALRYRRVSNLGCLFRCQDLLLRSPCWHNWHITSLWSTL